MQALRIVAIAVVATMTFAADEVMMIDSFDYPDVEAARKLWKPREAHPPVEVAAEAKTDGGVRIPCPFAAMDTDRTYADRDVALDLSGISEISLDVLLSDPRAVRSLSLYFRSGAGWYGKSFSLKQGWNSLAATKASFHTEDQPTGWHAVEGIRLSPWRGEAVDAICTVDNLRARSHTILVVTGDAAVAQGSSEAKSVQQFAEAAVGMLQETGLSVGSVSDADAERGALKKAKIAILAYNPVVTDATAEALKQFVERGGKLVAFYSLRGPLAELLGIRQTGWVKQERPGHFAEIRFDASDVQGLPASVRQRSWNITVAEPAAKGARVMGRWFDDEGRDVAQPAVLMSDTGVFMAHVLLGGDLAVKRQMLLSWLGHYEPGLWAEAVSTAIAKAGATGPMETLGDLAAFVNEKASQYPKGAAAIAALRQAQDLLEQARKLGAQGEHINAMETARQASDAAGRAYRLCHAPRTCEFRAVWNHSGTGAFNDWEKSMKNLADGGFNAVVPNMWWAGRAHYKSEYLPLSKTCQQHGDQIVACLAAAKKHGIEVHPWKVNWNLSGAPKEFVEKMRSEGRTQVNPTGKPMDWLCPSHPLNYELELKTMAEVAEKYDVDGVHFDYIRYPGRQGCYCAGCRERFEKVQGRRVENWPADVVNGKLADAYTDFRCAQITRLVKATSEQVHRLKPYCKISAAVFGSYPACRMSVAQDWVKWVKEDYLDFVCPMDYIKADHAFAQRVSIQMRQIAGRIPFYPGIGVTLRYTKTCEEGISQIELAREAGADGFIIFNYSDSLAEQCVPGLGEAILSEPAIHPHNAPRVEFKLPTKQVEETHFLIAEGLALRAQAIVRDLGRHRKPATGIQAQLRLEAVDGRVLEVYDAVNKPGASVAATVARRDGDLRLALAGTLVFEDGASRPFVSRSLPFRFAAD